MLKFILGFGAGVAIGMVLRPRSGAISVGHPMASESAPDLGEGDSRDELGLPLTINAVRV